jgi:hypothetical protein
MGEGIEKVVGRTKKITPVMTIVMFCLIRTRPIPELFCPLSISFLSCGSFYTLKMETVGSSETPASSTKHTVLHTKIP